MKIFLEPTTDSRGVMRVRDALVRYKPKNVEIVSSPSECDLAVVHVYGRHSSTEKQIASLKKAGKRYAMIQYALRSTMRPSTKDWIDMWKGAEVVWSYYNLKELAIEDNVSGNFLFYYAPLGVDPKVFKETKQERKFIVMASSQHALAEGARECAFAAKAVRKPMFFLGHELRRGSDIICKTGISDEELANYYSKTTWVSGLRRVEGFELPVIEGLLCGARPIVFDRPHYRHWFDKLAVHIPEEPREKVIENLTGMFQMADIVPPTVTEEEKAIVRERFNWQTIMKGFYGQLT
mgnify:CR=1 FL=1